MSFIKNSICRYDKTATVKGRLFSDESLIGSELCRNEQTFYREANQRDSHIQSHSIPYKYIYLNRTGTEIICRTWNRFCTCRICFRFYLFCSIVFCSCALPRVCAYTRTNARHHRSTSSLDLIAPPRSETPSRTTDSGKYIGRPLLVREHLSCELDLECITSMPVV